MRDVKVYGGLYDLGSGRAQPLLDGLSLSSIALNTRDLGSPSSPDYLIAGPGSQVWIVGYSIRASRPFPFPAPANPLGLDLEVSGSYDVSTPFTFLTEQRIILPVYDLLHHHAGRARIESPVVQLLVNNQTGNDLEISYQFWGKGF